VGKRAGHRAGHRNHQTGGGKARRRRERAGGSLRRPQSDLRGRGSQRLRREAWRKYRDALGATGFTFEYSATFGQALSAARNDPLTAEYGKAIVFDYSYHYFYGDGYGKDFRILNLRDETEEAKTELLLLGNLLSFYEQQAGRGPAPL